MIENYSRKINKCRIKLTKKIRQNNFQKEMKKTKTKK